MGFDVYRVRGVRVRGMRGVRHLARLVAALRMRVRVRPQLLAVLSVRPLLVLEVPQALVVPLDLVSQRRILDGSAFLVQLQAAGAVQPLQIDPASPSHAHAVHYETGNYVNLLTKKHSFKKRVRQKIRAPTQ